MMENAFVTQTLTTKTGNFFNKEYEFHNDNMLATDNPQQLPIVKVKPKSQLRHIGEKPTPNKTNDSVT